MSLEFLIGRLLRDALCNLGMTNDIREALKLLGVELDSSDDVRRGEVNAEEVTVAPKSILVLIEARLPEEDRAHSSKLRSAGATDEQIAALAQQADIEGDWYESVRLLAT